MIECSDLLYSIILYFYSFTSLKYGTGILLPTRCIPVSFDCDRTDTGERTTLLFAFNLSDSLLDIHSSYCALIMNFTKNTVQVFHIHLLLYT